MKKHCDKHKIDGEGGNIMEEKRELNEIMEEIIEMIEEKKYRKVRDVILEYNAVDIAEILEEVLDEVDVDSTIILFRMLPKDIAVDVFSYLNSDDRMQIVDGITEREINYIIEELDFDDKIDVLEELPANVVTDILERTPRAERKKINTFLNYPEDSAGSLMTPDYISLKKTMTVEEAMAHIKKEGMDSETIYTCYVKGPNRMLEGIVSLRTLVVSDNDTLIGDLMHEDFVQLNVLEDQEEVAEAFKKYGYMAIPVVDNEKRLVGIITVDDIFEVIEEETTEDIERMAGVMDSTDKEYLDTSVLQHIKSRLPWLIFLMISLMITGVIIAQFEETLSKVIILVAYLPLLMGTGGNTGSQTSTLIIRSMALGDLDIKDVLKVLWKEFRISISVGLILSALNFLKILYIDKETVLIAFTVSLAMLIIVVFAKLIGGMLPIAAKKIGIDPALMANPMIASITDMFSATTYLLLAVLILGI